MELDRSAAWSPEACRRRLARSAGAIGELVRGVAPADARWKADARAWSILEVVGHLHDEEREDFRARLELVLDDPGRPWPPIDPEGWVVSRSYNERDLDETLGRFLDERERSLAWLAGLRDPDWSATHPHPRIGPLRAGDLLASWMLHDLLHLRQLARIQSELDARAAGPFDTAYAGRW